MSRKKDRKIRQQKIKDAGSLASIHLQDMKLKDLKRAVIVLGMPFEEVVSSSVPQLESYYIRHQGNKMNIELLDKFDEWHEDHLKNECGLGPEYFHPDLKLGYVTEEDPETGEVKKRRIKGYKKTRKKRTKNEFGIFSGTKKALTYECFKQGLTKQETIEKVMEQFPEAREKSIGIWYNKAKKASA